MRRLVLLSLLVVSALACNAEERDVVARVGGREILRSQLRCPRQISAGTAECAVFQQKKLEELVFKELLPRAARKAGIVISDEEIVRKAPGDMLNEKRLREGEANLKKMARAVLAVKDGADPDHVFAEQIAPDNGHRPTFDHFVNNWTREDAQRHVSEDLVPEFRRQLIAQQRQQEQFIRLDAHIQQIANSKRIPFGDAKAHFWKSVLEEEVTIVDPRFSMPDLRGYV